MRFCHKKVFISHSSENKDIVEHLNAFIEQLGVKADQIFCSSIISQGLDNGEELGKTISNAINLSKILVYVLSYDFIHSEYCMQELGAGWHLSEQEKAKCYCLILPDINLSEIKGFVNSKVFKFTFIDEKRKGELGLFAENICQELHIALPKHSVLSNYENVFFSAVTDKIKQLLLHKEIQKKQEKEKEERISYLEQTIDENNRTIETLKKDVRLLCEKNKQELLKNEKRIIERTFIHFGIINGVSPQQYKCNPKEFWFSAINHYQEVLEELGLKPDDTEMELIMATVYAAAKVEDKAYEHAINYVKLSCESHNSVYPYAFQNFFQGYSGSATELISIFSSHIEKEKEGLTKDSYRDTLSYLVDRESKLNSALE